MIVLESQTACRLSFGKIHESHLKIPMCHFYKTGLSGSYLHASLGTVYTYTFKKGFENNAPGCILKGAQTHSLYSDAYQWDSGWVKLAFDYMVFCYRLQHTNALLLLRPAKFWSQENPCRAQYILQNNGCEQLSDGLNILVAGFW